MSVKGAYTREKLLDVAEELALERGFWTTSFSDICQNAGVNRGNFYYHFKTKKALLEAVIERKLKMVAVSLVEIESRTADPKKRLSLYMDGLKEKAEVYMNFGCPVGGLVVELAKRSPEHLPHLARAFENTLDWLEAQAKLLSGNPRTVAYRIHQTFQGAIVQAAAMKSQKPLKAARKNINNLIKSL